MSSSCVILASDFSDRVTDTLRDRWTFGKMRHVIGALDGSPVAITTDNLSGHTLLGVRLTGLTETINCGPCVVIDGDGPEWPRPCAYPLRSLGSAIVPLDSETGARGAKWTALDTYRTESSAAIAQAKQDRPECDYGKWSATPARSSVAWRYDPQNGPAGTNAAFSGSHAFAYGSYQLSDLAR